MDPSSPEALKTSGSSSVPKNISRDRGTKPEFTENSHYSLSLLPHELKAWAQKYAKILRRALKRGEYPILGYRGMSGVAAATALSFYLSGDFGMMYVRKPDEDHHNLDEELAVETSFGGSRSDYETEVLVFVDDFISGGKTREAVVEAGEEVLLTPNFNVITVTSNGNDGPYVIRNTRQELRERRYRVDLNRRQK